jgi:hypothetical protein
MIQIKLFCNILKETDQFRADTKSEVLSPRAASIKVSAKNKKGDTEEAWINVENLHNFRYRAWYSGNKTEFLVAKKLANIANVIYKDSGQDILIRGQYNIPQIKKLIDQYSSYAEYLSNRD